MSAWNECGGGANNAAMQILEVVVNGRTRRFPEGLTLLEAFRRIGVEIPSVCYDSRARPGADCRLCSVQVEGESRASTACTRAVEPGMSVWTHTPALEAFRRSMLELLAAHCSIEAATHLPEKELHSWFAAYGVEPRLAASDPAAVDDSHPHFRFDPAQCIACCRCVRVCEDLQGQFVWRMIGRGGENRLTVDRGERLADSTCVGCGACADACPTAALVDRSRLELGAASQWTRTTCSYCGVGCELRVGTRDGRIVQVRPEPTAPVSKGHLCSKGRYAWSFGSSADRITQPLLRGEGGWRVVGWDEALDHAAALLARLRDQHGPDAIGVLGSARAVNEENYLIQKFARLAIGSNNVDCCARVCHTPSAAAMKHMLGTGAATNAFDDIERAAAILVVGANPTENHPIVGARIKQQALRGARLLVIDPRRIELAQYAELHLAPRPGTNIPLLHALAQVILSEGLWDRQFVQARVDGLEVFESFVRQYTPERAAEICGVPAQDIRAAARLYVSVKPAMSFHGLGLTEHVQGTESVMALVNLALLTGNLGKPGAGVNPLRGQNNVQGAAIMGCEPSVLTGGAPIEAVRARFEEVWGAPVPVGRGLHLLEMIDAAAAGRLKALYVVGYDILLTLPKTAAVRSALARLDALIVQDLVMNETAREFGTVFLPAATTFEKDGTFMNAERRIQRVRKAIDAPGLARTDAWIVAELARRLGAQAHFAFASADQIWDEVRQVWPAVAGISYGRIEAEGLQWPCPTLQHPGLAVLHVDAFADRPRARLECVEFTPTPEVVDERYPFMLMTGRNLYQFNAGTMTSRTANQQLRPHDTLDIAPTDARALGIVEGERLRVVSRRGAAVLPARLDERLRPGQLFATFHEPASALNRLTSDVRDRRVGTPEYKVTAVRVEKIGA